MNGAANTHTVSAICRSLRVRERRLYPSSTPDPGPAAQSATGHDTDPGPVSQSIQDLARASRISVLAVRVDKNTMRVDELTEASGERTTESA
jgi:hypothetical protein